MIPTMSISSRGRGRKHCLSGRSGPGRPPKQPKVKDEEGEENLTIEEEIDVKPIILGKKERKKINFYFNIKHISIKD